VNRPEITQGTQVRVLKWDGQYTGTVRRREGDDVFVAVHGHLAEEQLDVTDVEALTKVPR
jgi:hypothetical protein